ncbi:hypothetical protein GCM10023231_41330 [Olivibacter ginsenosidimutans]|uniref:Lipocalin-like domain-containing protein n=1 Tax=Olivibacter ginsenosidimutans TaxID=1176537 RepID=A0ABP9CBE0_9SPHI
MQSVRFFKTICFELLLILLAFACKKKNISNNQTIIGTWKSTQTITEVYEDGQLSGTYLLPSDQRNFSKLTFDSLGHFKSSGQYATTVGDSLVIVTLSPQRGSYRLTADQLITSLENMDKEATLTITFKNNDQLILTTKTITGLTEKTPKQFIAITTYTKEP